MPTPHFTVHSVHPSPCNCCHVARWMSREALIYMKPMRESEFHIVIDLTEDIEMKDTNLKRKRAHWWDVDTCYMQPEKKLRLVGIELNPGPVSDAQFRMVMAKINNLEKRVAKLSAIIEDKFNLTPVRPPAKLHLVGVELNPGPSLISTVWKASIAVVVTLHQTYKVLTCL